MSCLLQSLHATHMPAVQPRTRSTRKRAARNAYGRMKTASSRSSSDGCVRLSSSLVTVQRPAADIVLVWSAALLAACVMAQQVSTHQPAGVPVSYCPPARNSRSKMSADVQVLPMMVLLFVVVVIIILRAAWKPLPDAAQREALLKNAKQQVG